MLDKKGLHSRDYLMAIVENCSKKQAPELLKQIYRLDNSQLARQLAIYLFYLEGDRKDAAKLLKAAPKKLRSAALTGTAASIKQNSPDRLENWLKKLSASERLELSRFQTQAPTIDRKPRRKDK